MNRVAQYAISPKADSRLNSAGVEHCGRMQSCSENREREKVLERHVGNKSELLDRVVKAQPQLLHLFDPEAASTCEN